MVSQQGRHNTKKAKNQGQVQVCFSNVKLAYFWTYLSTCSLPAWLDPNPYSSAISAMSNQLGNSKCWLGFMTNWLGNSKDELCLKATQTARKLQEWIAPRGQIGKEIPTMNWVSRQFKQRGNSRAGLGLLANPPWNFQHLAQTYCFEATMMAFAPKNSFENAVICAFYQHENIANSAVLCR